MVKTKKRPWLWGRRKAVMAAFFLVGITAVLACRARASETQKFTLKKSSITLVKGKTYRLKASGNAAGKKVKWKSSKPSVAKVNSNGKVTARSAGTATITAAMGKKKATCRVKVIAASLNIKKASLATYETCTLKVKNASKKITWSSSKPSVASVSKTGKVTAKKAGKAVISAKVGQSTLKCTVTVKADRWSKLLTKYQDDPSVNQLVFVKYTGGTSAEVSMYQKKSSGWKRILKCAGYVGRNGVGKTKEGDAKTPTGTFALTHAFGIKSNPGAKMDYVKVNPYLYWCADRQYYNQLIDIRKAPHSCTGEHLMDYVPQYNYGMFTSYNKDNVYGKGSAIFLHCVGSNPYTGGCVAVSQENMIKIIQNAEPGTKICIYKK